VFSLGLAVATIHISGGCPTATGTTGQGMNLCGAPTGQSPTEIAVSMVAVTLFYALPLITAAYLAARLRWGRGRQAAATA